MRALVSFAVLACAAAGQNAAWSRLTTTALPPARSDAGLVYDLARSRFVAFGGYGTAGLLDDTWTFDGAAWTQAQPTAAPSQRRSPAMAYDLGSGRTLLFGGMADTTTLFDDLWAFDGADWTQLPTATTPGPRFRPCVAFDGIRNRLVMFGGWDGVADSDETWEYDGLDWQQVVTATRPMARNSARMAYDIVRGVIVLFGGITSAGRLDDTWQYDGVNWTQVPVQTVPPARSSHAMAYDLLRGTVVIKGGLFVIDASTTWEFDGVDWTPRALGGEMPERVGLAMAHDPVRDELLVFGGLDVVSVTDETWRLRQGTPATLAEYGAGCGAPTPRLEGSPYRRPVLGERAFAVLRDAPTPAAALAIGWSDQTFAGQPLPLSLAPLGMTGCDQLQSADALLSFSGAAPNGDPSFEPLLPTTPALVGIALHLQAFVFAPGANPLAITASNGLTWTLGDV